MSYDEMKQLLITLESIEVHGRGNLDKLLACIVFVDEKMKGVENGGLHADTDGQ